MNRTDIFNAVKLYSNRPTLPDPDLVLLTGVVEGELNRALREHPRNLLTAEYSLVAGTSRLPLPADMMQLLVLRCPADTVWKEYTPNSGIVGTQTRGYVNRGVALELNLPVSEPATFIIDYFASLCPLLLPTDTNWVARFFADVYVYGLLKELAVYLKDDDRLALWAAAFGERLMSLQAQGWGQNIAATPSMQ